MRFLSRPVPLALFFLLVLLAFRIPFRGGAGVLDVDAYWHLEYGDWILANGVVPKTDFWSWSFTDAPYRLTQWLGEVVLALSNQMAGELGMRVVSSVLVVATVGMSYLAARCYLPNRLAAILVALGGNAALLLMNARAQQFSMLFIAVLAWILAEYDTRRRTKLLWLIPVIMALWINLHGAFVIGLAYIGLIAAAGMAEGYMRHDADAIKTALRLLPFAFMGALATLLNPFGIEAWYSVATVGNLKTTMSNIILEWSPTNINGDSGFIYWMLSTAMFAALAAGGRARPRTIMVAVIVAGLGWTAMRLSFLASLMMVPVLAEALRRTALYDLCFEGAPATRYDRDIPITLAVIAVMAVFFVAEADNRWRAAPNIEKKMLLRLPVAEVDFLKRNALDGRIMNDPETGGYLIRNLRQPVFLDSRLDLYGDDLLFGFLDAYFGKPSWRGYIERHDPDILLIPKEGALVSLLQAHCMYRLVFAGANYALLLRSGYRDDLPALSGGAGCHTPSLKQ